MARAKTVTRAWRNFNYVYLIFLLFNYKKTKTIKRVPQILILAALKTSLLKYNFIKNLEIYLTFVTIFSLP